MPYEDLREFIERLEAENELARIKHEVSPILEMTEIADRAVKGGGKALLFENPKGYDIPVLMNAFGTEKRMKMALEVERFEEIGERLVELTKFKPESLFDGIKGLGMFKDFMSFMPKKVKKGACKEVIMDEPNLDKFPILQCWPKDAGRFITFPVVITKDPETGELNAGMYRMQVYDSKTTGMHWQIHKDASHFFDQYRDAGEMMPVSIAIGGDPLYIWCGQAPLPHGIFEMLLYGFVRNEPAKLVKSITNDIWIPEDADIVIEGMVDPNKLEIEGPFGDHTGYYTLKEPYPVMEVTAITMKENPVYQATVVGKPPLEDKYMGWGTERIFLPLLKTTAPDLIDYHMPENGVFHNLILAQMETHYKGHAKQFMHAFWGVGQMSFVKHAIFVGKDAPKLTEYEKITEHILNRIDPKHILITEGIVDALDHASPETLVGGKLGLDCTGDEIATGVTEPVDDAKLLQAMQTIDKNVTALKQYFTHTKTPVCVIAYKKERSVQALFDDIQGLHAHLKLVVVVDAERNDIDNPYMLVWRVANNIDALRDVRKEPFIMLDATDKNELDGYTREWPGDVLCDPEVLEDLKARGIIDIDDAFVEKFYL